MALEIAHALICTGRIVQMPRCVPEGWGGGGGGGVMLEFTLGII